jgi:hypothetical protein
VVWRTWKSTTSGFQRVVAFQCSRGARCGVDLYPGRYRQSRRSLRACFIEKVDQASFSTIHPLYLRRSYLPFPFTKADTRQTTTGIVNITSLCFCNISPVSSMRHVAFDKFPIQSSRPSCSARAVWISLFSSLNFLRLGNFRAVAMQSNAPFSKTLLIEQNWK